MESKNENENEDENEDENENESKNENESEDETENTSSNLIKSPFERRTFHLKKPSFTTITIKISATPPAPGVCREISVIEYNV
tara:strand:+ start:162 stop:410 length:249 start_codon:yes stop_codon:yes gene_type:complete